MELWTGMDITRICSTLSASSRPCVPSGTERRAAPRVRALLMRTGGNLISATLLALCAIASAESGSALAPSALWGEGLAAGPHTVGFRVIEHWDRTRAFPGLEARLSRSVSGTPRRRAEAPRMPYRAYVQLYEGGLSGGFPALDASASTRAEATWAQRYPDIAAHLLPPRRPPFVMRRSRMVLTHCCSAPGYGAPPLSHTALCEHLASHGGVVAASPSSGKGPSANVRLERSARTGPGSGVRARRPVHRGGDRSRPDRSCRFQLRGQRCSARRQCNARIGAVASLDGAVGFQHVLATRRTEAFLPQDSVLRSCIYRAPTRPGETSHGR